MKKLLTVIMGSIILYSCQKENIVANDEADLNQTVSIKSFEATVTSSGSYPVDFLFYNCATGEDIQINGTVKYRYKQSLTRFLYVINCEATGVGVNSGTKYHCTEHELFTVNKAVTTDIQKLNFVADNGTGTFTSSYYIKYYWDASYQLVIVAKNYIQTPCKY